MAQDKILDLEVEQKRKSLRRRKKAKGKKKWCHRSQKKKEFQGEVHIYVKCYQGFKLDKDRDLPIRFGGDLQPKYLIT